jgi:hypothetical protein
MEAMIGDAVGINPTPKNIPAREPFPKKTRGGGGGLNSPGTANCVLFEHTYFIRLTFLSIELAGRFPDEALGPDPRLSWAIIALNLSV